MANYVLIYFSPEEGEKRFPLEIRSVYRMGSKRDSDVLIPQKDVSRHHAMLRVHDGWFHVTDLKSKNGTFVNGQRVGECEIHCGDELCLSSARFVILETTSGVRKLSENGSDSHWSGPDARRALEQEGPGEDDTQRYRSEATVSDMIALLETAGVAAQKGTVVEPLAWGIERLGLDGAMILFRDSDQQISMIGSSGDLGPLVVDHQVLRDLAAECQPSSDGGPLLRQVEILEQSVLLAAIGTSTVLVMRHSGHPPAVGDLRALIAATELTLRLSAPGALPDQRCGVEPDSGAFTPIGGKDAVTGEIVLESLVDLSLNDARDRFESWFVARVVNQCGGNVSVAADRLGMSRQGLFKKMRKLNLKR
jgi:pSer/pThr/pTyr-binding forkhead associated (FHA) protein